MSRVSPRSRNHHLVLAAVCSLVVLALTPVAAQNRPLKKRTSELRPVSNIIVIPPGSAYRQTNLVSDVTGIATLYDELLVNPWGMALTASSPFWIANNGTSRSTLYTVSPGTNAVSFPAAPRIFTIPGGLPTGIVANGTPDFVVTSGASGPARFIFASITGNIAGWNPNVPAAGSTTAIIAASHPGRVYTGLALANNGVANFLYAADFANGNIDVYDTTYALVGGFPFADPTIPTTAGNTYHPHNIQAIGGSLYVMYAKVGTGGLPENGIGNGFVRRFNTNGIRDLTFGINNGPLDAPWGITIAPAPFGIFGGALLVGNFSDIGTIHGFSPTTGAFLGTLQDETGTAISIDELWGLQFGNGVNGGDPNVLYFTAGIAEEEHGLFGSLRPTTASATSLIQFSADSYVAGENSGTATITVTRAGDVSGTATINYAALPESQPGHAGIGSSFIEGSPAPFENPSGATTPDQSEQRKPGGAAGSTQDTGNNAADFVVLSPSNPQNLASPVTPISGTDPVSTSVVISEFRNYGPGGSSIDHFIELYNNTNAPIDISGWKLKNDVFGIANLVLFTVNAGTIIPARGHFLATRTPGYTGSVPGDQTYSSTQTFFGGIALTKADDTIVDQVFEDSCGGCGDVRLPPGTLTFGPGETSRTFQVLIRPDAFVEGEEIIDLVLSNPTGLGAGLGQPNIAVLHILDATGSPAPVPQISINDVALAEGNAGTTNFVFTLTRSGTIPLTATVAYSVAPDTATSPSDFPAASGVVTFNPSDTSKTITIPVNGDITVEPSETFFVNLSNTGNASIADAQGIGTIINDDFASDVSITKTAPATVALGATFSYSIVVNSVGTGTATGVTVTDVLPSGTTFVSATPSQGSCSGTSTVTCAVGSLAPSASATITITVVAPAAASVLSNTATVAAAGDTVASNNASTAQTGVGITVSIPTMSEWALMLLALAVMAIGVKVIRT